jgi:hypothetical protein
VAADAPALQALCIEAPGLGHASLAPLFDALPRNTHLRALQWSCNTYSMSEALLRGRLLPAVRTNTSLRELTVHCGLLESQALQQAQRLLWARVMADAAPH